MITFLNLKRKSRNDCIELAKSYVVIIMAIEYFADRFILTTLWAGNFLISEDVRLCKVKKKSIALCL